MNEFLRKIPFYGRNTESSQQLTSDPNVVTLITDASYHHDKDTGSVAGYVIYRGEKYYFSDSIREQ